MQTTRIIRALAAATILAVTMGETAAQDRSSPAGVAPSQLGRFGLVGDGEADDTRAIQKMVNSRRGDILLPRGVYRISRTIVIELDKVGPTSIIGSGAARLVMTGPGPALKFIGTHEGTASPATVKDNVWRNQRMPTVDGIEIVGAHAEADGIEAVGTMKLIVSRVVVRKARHAIHLITRNRNVIVSNCHLYENSGVGLYLDDVNLHQINVSSSHISYNGGGGIVVRAGNVRNLHVTGCDIEGNMSPDGPPTANVLMDCRGGANGVAEVAIVGCTIQHSHGPPGSANIRFIGMDLDERRFGNLTIADNVLSDVQINVDIQKARGVSIAGNTIWKGVQYNLRVEDSTHVVVGPNMLDRNPRYGGSVGADNGVLFRNCQNCTITGLHVSGVQRQEAGLVLDNCRRMNVTGCTILDCDNAGILLRKVTTSRVSDCLIDADPSRPGPWVPLIVSEDSNVRLSDNLLGQPIVATPAKAEAR
jgi:parallel beta helix pectate lyase-like protein